MNKNSKISKKNIALISTLGIFLLIGFIGIPEFTRHLLFYPDAPTANFPIPNNETEARLQDLEDLNPVYFSPVGRTLPEDQIFKLEHFVIAES